MEPPSQEETFLQQPHHPIVRKAAEALDDEGILVVEYGQQLEWRHGDPEVLMVSNKNRGIRHCANLRIPACRVGSPR
jgi:hypothetical protein